MADKKKLSVAEILAAARKSDTGGASGAAEGAGVPEVAQTAPESEKSGSQHSAEAEAATPPPKVAMAGESKPSAAKPSAAKPTGSGGRLSVAEMMAQARGEGTAGAKPSVADSSAAIPVATPASAKKEPAKKEKPAAAAPVTEAAAVSSSVIAAPAGGKDTASILATARKTARLGPTSKAEAEEARREVAAAPMSAATVVAKKPAAKPTVPPMPTRPPRPVAAPAEAAEDRRFFLAVLVGSFLAVGFTALAATFTLWTLGLARFMFPNILTEPPSRFKVGFPSDFPPGAVEEKFKALFGVWIAKAEYQGQMQIFALRTVCTHLGCTPNWLDAEQKFKCPCHGSGFYKDGINFEGPAPRPLERYAITLASDGQLEVDKSKLFQQEMGQWENPASFWPA